MAHKVFHLLEYDSKYGRFSVDHPVSEQEVDIGAFILDNADGFDADDVTEIVELERGAAFQWGGGAQPLFRVIRVK